ncbi:class I SAM-dependent methyltransferase [Chroococcidiopsis sp. CCMEE 29]|uniref:class I SAM-dependent methyltransferase n=1 Tax=Chroococcidiopsis sp. CCMEE 29 TaxID=155894 RepID=UPI0020210198|nr:class I SAM-dependent methyltransferase [Chroococcidiopsis sp. CCMEE 29]
MTKVHSYFGICNICGYKGEFSLSGSFLRESYNCPSCRASLRYRDQAALIIDEFGKGQSIFLQHMVGQNLLDNVWIYETALRGPFVHLFKKLPNYYRSYLWEDRSLGDVDQDGVRCEDLTQLTFSDNLFDLVITSDVMEHVYDFKKAFAEINRVLKPGGVHIFTIPNQWPLPKNTESRVAVIDGVEHFLKPPRYHNAGDGDRCIVYHDYGADLIDILDSFGCKTQVVRRHSGLDVCYVNATFISRKMGNSLSTSYVASSDLKSYSVGKR